MWANELDASAKVVNATECEVRFTGIVFWRRKAYLVFACNSRF